MADSLQCLEPETTGGIWPVNAGLHFEYNTTSLARPDSRFEEEHRNMSSRSWVRKAVAGMTGYVPGEQPGVAKYIKLNTNENAFPPSPTVLDAIRSAATERLMRYPDPMATSFRLAASRILDVDPEMILCGNGSDDLLTICTRTFVGESERVRYPYPSYILYRTLAEIQGATWDESHFTSDWTLSADFAKPLDDLRLVYLPNPNSPSGTVIELDQIAELASRLPCPLIVDEAYAEFARVSALPLVREHDNLIVLRTLSKSHALAGLRFGYLVASSELVEQLAKVKDSYNCDMLSIAGATAAITQEAWLEENIGKIEAGRQRLESMLRRHRFDVTPSRANFVWCTHRSVESQAIYERLKERGILVRYMVYPGWGEGLRVTVGTPDQLEALDQMLAEVLA